MKEIVYQIADSSNSDKLSLFVKLIDCIRPASLRDSSSAYYQLTNLKQILSEDSHLRKGFKSAFIDILVNTKQSELFTQVNLISRRSLLAEIRKRLFRKILPLESDASTLRGIINIIFYKKDDYKWLGSIPNEYIVDLLTILEIKNPSELATDNKVVDELLNDIYILSQIISSLSIDWNIVKNFDAVLDMDSPFMELHEKIDNYIWALESNSISRKASEEKYHELQTSIINCFDFVKQIKESKSKFGTSLELTVVLQKIELSLKRMKELLQMIVVSEDAQPLSQTVSFAKKLIRIENQKNSIRIYFNETISLLAFQITEHTGKIGEHYVTTTAKEYFEMFINALKGGFIVGILVITKFLINGLHLPLFQDTLLKALNYSFGFIGIQLVHGTLATKQPSMTASTIAHSIESQTETEEVKEIGEFIIKVFRSQFIAVMGNIIIALPVSFAISWIWFTISGNHVASYDKGLHKIEELNPFTTLCVLHGAIAGVMLFISGVLAGASENANIYNGYSNRIKKQSFLLKVLGKSRTERLGNYVADNIGGLTGNFTLGFFLAFMAFFGAILGLNIDIQHVTFASGNLGLGLAATYGKIGNHEIMMASLGILFIGVVNIAVSFSLALAVAIKSRGIKLTKSAGVLLYIMKSFVKHPLLFFFPPKSKS
jgi:site-specific recombinase